jgi:hypothetical protein
MIRNKLAALKEKREGSWNNKAGAIFKDEGERYSG